MTLPDHQTADTSLVLLMNVAPVVWSWIVPRELHDVVTVIVRRDLPADLLSLPGLAVAISGVLPVYFNQ